MTSQTHSRLLNRLAVIPRALDIRVSDEERDERNGNRDEGFAEALRALESRVRRLERRA